MSGPKVFHVVTREELVARCEVHLRQLDAAIAEWTKACKHKGAADAHDTEAVASRRDALRRMLKDGRFSELQKQVPAELSFLRTDAQAARSSSDHGPPRMTSERISCFSIAPMVSRPCAVNAAKRLVSIGLLPFCWRRFVEFRNSTYRSRMRAGIGQPRTLKHDNSAAAEKATNKASALT
jgi:hypothetical protein